MNAKLKFRILSAILTQFYKFRCSIEKRIWGNESLVWIVQNVISDEVRKNILIRYGASISKTARLRRGLYIHCALGKKPFANLYLGDNVYIDKNVLIDMSDEVHIGNNSRVACGSKIYTHFASHYRGPVFYDTVKAPVFIGNDSRCSPNSVIACGVKVGNKVLIGACSFIKAYSVLEDSCLYGGVPAKLIVKY